MSGAGSWGAHSACQVLVGERAHSACQMLALVSAQSAQQGQEESSASQALVCGRV